MTRLGRKMEMDEYKTVVKDMLGYVHKVCVENGIRYFVAFGTLLGTIRHNGFIPWDDDIDIWMLGEDYEKFVEVFTRSTSEFYILDSENSPYYYNLMARICSKAGVLKMKGVTDVDNLGPFIDIFRLYKCPADREERMAYYQQIVNLNVDIKFTLPMRYFKTVPFKRKIAALVHSTLRLPKRFGIGTAGLKREREQLIRKYEGTDTPYYHSLSELNRTDKRLFTADEVMNVEPHPFEDIEVMVPTAYDQILTRIFGDYMQLPPVEQRVPHHHFVPYWKA